MADADNREEAVSIYARSRRSFKTIAQHVHDAIRDKIDPNIVHKIEYRAKDITSFRKKSLKEEDGQPKYIDPLNQITDLAGVRVIVFVRDNVDIVCQVVADIFDVIDKEDVGERVYQQGKFGYQSMHILVRLDRRMYLADAAEIKEAVCEIQVRTILQHAWAEMEHDIQYKGDQVPAELGKRFSALAGLLEIADGEFQRIQADSDKLHEAVAADLMDNLTQQRLSESAESGSAEPSTVTRVRELVAQGDYREAVNLYSEKLRLEPTNHPLYIGRAKARFLAGDTTGALKDLNRAEELEPTDETIRKTRSLIESGDFKAVLNQGTASSFIKPYLDSGVAALRAGNGVQAFEDYVFLESHGYHKAFSIYNKALACTVEGDLAGARDLISQLWIIPTTPMSVSIWGLKLIIDIMDGKDCADSEKGLVEAVSQAPNFSMNQSHLRYLLEGLKTKDSPHLPQMLQVLDNALARN